MTKQITNNLTIVDTSHWVCKKVTVDQMKSARERRVRAMAKKGKRSVFKES